MFSVKSIADLRFGSVLFIGMSSSCCGGYEVEVVLTFKKVECGRRIASFHDFFLHTTAAAGFFKMKLTIAYT